MGAISTHNSRVECSSLDFHHLVCSFLKGAKCLNPAHCPLSPVWKLPLVLESLCQSPFEPMEDAQPSFWLWLPQRGLLTFMFCLSQSCMRWKPKGYPLAQTIFPP